MPEGKELRGGVNVVRQHGEVVHRPVSAATPTIHRLLRHVRAQGFDGAPEPLGFDADGQEMLTFLHGEVHEALPPELRTSELLDSAAVLLRRFQDASAAFEIGPDDRWWLPASQPAEVVCHGDAAPYNCVVRNGRAVGLIDFDAAHPGPRMWDVAYAVYRFAPLHAPGNPDSYGSVAEQGRRAARFCRAYGVPADAALPGMVTDRLRDLMEFMRDQAAQGNEAFQSHIKDGHLSLYQADPLYRRQPRGPCQGLWRGVTVSRGLLLTSWYPPSPGGTETYARRLFTHSPAYGWTTTRPRPHPANRPRRPWYDFHSDQHHPGSA